MSITNFEEITKELSAEDYSLVTHLLRGFQAHTKQNPIKAVDIVKAINKNHPELKTKFTQVKLRKLCNFIRAKGMIGLIATSNGYYTSTDIKEIRSQIISLYDRANAIVCSADGLHKLIKRLEQKTDS